MMYKTFLSFLILVSCLLFSEKSSALDPYQNVEEVRLDNGMRVILAPSAKARTTKIHTEVEVGWYAENVETAGTAHLLEHMLFYSEKLPKNMTYLEYIKEAGGNANGYTMADTTTYDAEVPAGKSHWLIEKIAEMLLGRTLNAKFLEKARSTVFLEITEPTFLDYVFGHDRINDFLSPRFYERPTFWESEFGLIYPDQISRSQTRLTTKKLSLDDLQELYDDYYRPANMVVYIAGNFDAQVAKKVLVNAWGKFPDKNGKSLPRPKPVYRDAPYKRSSAAYRSAFITMGMKLHEITFQEDLILRSYLGYLSHRLMKEIRNSKGETYTVRDDIYITDDRYGYGVLSFESPDARYKDHLNTVRDYFDTEATQGLLSDKQIQEAKKLSLDKYDRVDVDSGAMLHLAKYFGKTKKAYGSSFTSPYSLLSKISPEEYRKGLMNLFQSNKNYVSLQEPPLFFKFEYVIAILVVLLLSKRFYRKKWGTELPQENIECSLSVHGTPLFLLEGITILYLLTLLGSIPHDLLSWVFDSVSAMQSSFIYSSYLNGIAHCFVFMGNLFFFASLISRKFLISGDKIFIKSLSSYAKVYPLEHLEKISLKSPFQALLDFKMLLKNPRAWGYYSWKVWQPGLELSFRGGKRHFLGFANVNKVKADIESALIKRGHAPHKADKVA